MDNYKGFLEPRCWVPGPRFLDFVECSGLQEEGVQSGQSRPTCPGEVRLDGRLLLASKEKQDKGLDFWKSFSVWIVLLKLENIVYLLC